MSVLVGVDAIHAAWRDSFRHVEDAIRSVLRARLDLLEAGFGDDHPMCLTLDEHAASLRRLNDIQRVSVLGADTPRREDKK